jgi:isoleucyl-tRNA synthetase
MDHAQTNDHGDSFSGDYSSSMSESFTNSDDGSAHPSSQSLSSLSKRTPYPVVNSQLNLPDLEQRVLQFWDDDKTFQASIDKNPKGESEFVFYDGPPFANGLPHYGHLLTGFVKDAVPRYQTMRGRRVERRFGWDCHGLPAEMTTEKELGVTNGRIGIEELGIDVFNDHCSQLVNRTADEWYRYVRRQARWVDFTNDYKTMDPEFMESVLWAFRSLYDKGLIYEGYRVLPYCWECETPLSNFETRQDDSYRPKIDPAVTVSFELHALSQQQHWSDGPISLLAWTTTPWTLPSNLALAVGEEITYVGVLQHSSGRILVLAQERLGDYLEVIGDHELLGTIQGRELLGRSFDPIFNFFSNHPNAFVVISGDFVSTEEGTGIVQMAPGFGEEDQNACAQASISVVCPVDSRGRFTSEVGELVGRNIFEANLDIIELLKLRGVLFEYRPYEHQYPHCWRTDTPLIYRAVSSWFVNVTALKDRLLERNQEITWVPSHVKDGSFGRWLEGARDWSITRNRYWGAPIPVWKSTDPAYPRIDVYGSKEELEADFKVKLEDLHRPFIDTLTRPNPDDPTGRSMMVRVPDILDCWFESGSMPYAQLHYPFENKESFEQHFPADFIVEYIGQTRGWFYTLHVLSVALFDQPPFQHCLAHGILLGEDGRKLSKRLKNYPDPWEVFENIGADAMRWFLLSSSILRGQDLILEKDAMIATVKHVINPIWNAYYFLTLYANADDVKGERNTSSTNLLDRYILAKLARVVSTVTYALDHYELSDAAAEIELFLDALNNWYIRRSRERFWSKSGTSSESDTAKANAYNTLHTVLSILLEISAPLLPLLSEELYKGLTDERSVHLQEWPETTELPHDDRLVEEMDLVREVCSLGHSIRKSEGIRARLPLQRITVAGPRARTLQPYLALIAEELNVKEVELIESIESAAELILNVIPAKVGPRLGPETQKLMRAAREREWSTHEEGVFVGGHVLYPGEYDLHLTPLDSRSVRILSSRQEAVSLELTVTDQLEREGIARDLIREIQNARKDADLVITDHVVVTLQIQEGNSGAQELQAAFDEFQGYIAEQVLADTLTLSSAEIDATSQYRSRITVHQVPLELSLNTVS